MRFPAARQTTFPKPLGWLRPLDGSAFFIKSEGELD
jgi:hypothetical protein